MQTKRWGFALSETMVSLALVAVVGVLVIRSSGANAVVSAQAVATVSAARLAAELSDWTRRGGLRALGVAADQALAEVQAAAPCHAGLCDATQGARHYLFRWHTRLLDTVSGARVVLCVDQLPVGPAAGSDWTCDSAGGQAVLKLGWPPYPGSVGWRPALAIALGPAA